MKEIWCSDFETITPDTQYYKQNNDTRVLLACSTNWEERSSLFVCIEDWFKFHLELGKSHIVYFHNLSWDGEFIIRFLANNTKFRYDQDETMKKNANTYRVFRQGGRIYYIHLFVRYKKDNKVYRFTIEFKCSFRLLNSSIGMLGKSVGIDKHLKDEDDTFYNLEPVSKLEDLPDRFKEYCINDTLIALKSLKNFAESIINVPVVKKLNDSLLKKRQRGVNALGKLTSASTTKWLMKMYCRNYNYKLYKEFNQSFNDKYLTIDLDTYEMSSFWFKGGFTQINEKYLDNPQDVGRSIMIDVTSAYPYQMTFDLPYGRLTKDKPDHNSFIKFYKIKVTSAKIKKSHFDCVCLFNWKKTSDLNNRYVRELSNFECFYIEDEWLALNKFYNFDVAWMEVYYCESRPFLKDYASDLFNIKDHYAKTKQLGLKQSAKILLNAGYGCLAQRMDYVNYMYFYKEDFAKMNLTEGSLFKLGEYEYKFKRINETFNFCPEKLVLVEAYNEYEKSVGVNKLAAVVITGRQRAYLFNKIDEYGASHFAMCDTDSILLTNLTDDLVKRIQADESEELGGWEIENKNYNIRWFGTYGAKKYVILDDDKKPVKLKFAGVSENTSHFSEIFDELDFSQDEILIKDAVYERIYVKSGIVLKKKDKVIAKGTL